MTNATTAPVTTPKAEEIKQTIPQKVEALQAEKTRLTSDMANMPEGADKVAVQERITVIDRKLRWYAGRSSEGKAVKAVRPTKAPKAEKKAKVAKPAEPTPVPVASTVANES